MQDLSSNIHPWSMDMWSIGTIFLEILTGFPMWLGLKGRTVVGKRSITSMGLFAAPGRDSVKIMQKQRAVVNNFEMTLLNQEISSEEKEGLIQKI